MTGIFKHENKYLRRGLEEYLRTWNTLAIFPMARILLRITSLRAETVPPGNKKKVQETLQKNVSH